MVANVKKADVYVSCGYFPLFYYSYFPYLQLSCLLYCSRDLLDIAWSLGVLIPRGRIPCSSCFLLFFLFCLLSGVYIVIRDTSMAMMDIFEHTFESI
jgi:hypothetical protein